MSHPLPKQVFPPMDVHNQRLVSFVREGIKLILQCKIQKFERRNTRKIIHYESNGQVGSVVVDKILVGAGRSLMTKQKDLAKCLLRKEPIRF
jgi:pyruvate/2-oxoglutarate dehydrogenase complex dihydrolipoamide dehydrogenase (E3) component